MLANAERMIIDLFNDDFQVINYTASNGRMTINDESVWIWEVSEGVLFKVVFQTSQR
jgi:hypothetical protein